MSYKIYYPTSLSEINSNDDNIDICVTCEDGEMLTFVVATIENVKHLLENGVLSPTVKFLIADELTQSKIEKVIGIVMSDKQIRNFYGKN